MVIMDGIRVLLKISDGHVLRRKVKKTLMLSPSLIFIVLTLIFKLENKVV